MRFASFFAFLFLCLSVGASEPIGGKKPTEPHDISGVWAFRGSEGGGKPYSGIVIFKKVNDGYLANYVHGIGGTSLGVAHVSGDDVIVSWRSQVGPGTTLYKIDATGKKLSGKWIAFPETRWHSEEAEFKMAWPDLKEDAETLLPSRMPCVTYGYTDTRQ